MGTGERIELSREEWDAIQRALSAATVVRHQLDELKRANAELFDAVREATVATCDFQRKKRGQEPIP